MSFEINGKVYETDEEVICSTWVSGPKTRQAIWPRKKKST